LGNVQLYDAKTDSLVLVAQRGFSDEFLAHFHVVSATDVTACGRALALREPVFVEDIHSDPAYAPLRPWAMRAGYQSVYSVPMFRRDGALIGVLSTHFAASRRLSERELRLTDLYLRLVVELIERAQAEEAAAAELADIELLRDLGARLVGQRDMPLLFKEVLAAAIVLTRADAGTVQLLDEVSQELVLLVAQGFDEPMSRYFARVDASSKTTCGRALAEQHRLLLDYDDRDTEDADQSLQLHVHAGYVSAQSTPLVTRAGTAIGMLSTHWRTHQRPTDRELRLIDLLARQAADLIALARTDQFEGSNGDGTAPAPTASRPPLELAP
jgi:GAF domain-containing protein